MARSIDPNQIVLTGENSFMRLLEEKEGEPLTFASHWRVLYSKGGSGHALFLRGELTENRIEVYSDNIALARWLQEGPMGAMRKEFADTDLPVIDAYFTSDGDTRAFWSERIESDEGDITMTWYDFGEPLMLNAPPGANQSHPYGVFSCLIPARRVQFIFDGIIASGQPYPSEIDGRPSSTCCLAFSETWTLPFKK